MGNDNERCDSRLAAVLANGGRHRLGGTNRRGVSVWELVECRAIDREGPRESLVRLDNLVC